MSSRRKKQKTKIIRDCVDDDQKDLSVIPFALPFALPHENDHPESNSEDRKKDSNSSVLSDDCHSSSEEESDEAEDIGRRDQTEILRHEDQLQNMKNNIHSPSQSHSSDSEVGHSSGPPMADRSYRFAVESQNFANETEELIVGLHPGDTLHLVGSGELLCLSGDVEILGCRLYASKEEHHRMAFHSSRYQGCLTLEAKGSRILDHPLASGNVGNETAPITSDEAKERLLSKGFEVVVLFNSLQEKAFDALLTSKKDAIAVEEKDTKLSTRVHGLHVSLTSPYGRGFWPLTIDPPWKNLADTLVGGAPESGATSMMVTGSKGVGKSTFCRYLINRLLSRFHRVAVLDLDVGQPEFTPPGLLSLCLVEEPILSPPALHLATPLRSCFMGSNTTKVDPVMFTNHVRQLIQFYRDSYSLDSTFLEQTVPPLVINTDGWVRGLGLELLGAVVDILSPNHLVKLTNPNKPSTKFHFDSPQSTRVYEIDGGGMIPGLTTGKVTAATLRAHRFLNYFLSGFKDLKKVGGSHSIEIRSGDIYDPENCIARLFAQQIPYTVPWGVIKLRFMGQGIVPTEAFHCLNGALVGLLDCDLAQFPPLPSASGNGHGQVTCLSQAPVGWCIGLGIVHSICPAKKEYCILSPLTVNQLQHCNCFAQGPLFLPSIIYQNSFACSAPYISAEAISGHGALALKSRKNLKRVGQEHPKVEF